MLLTKTTCQYYWQMHQQWSGFMWWVKQVLLFLTHLKNYYQAFSIPTRVASSVLRTSRLNEIILLLQQLLSNLVNSITMIRKIHTHLSKIIFSNHSISVHIFDSYLPLIFLKYRYITLWNTSGNFFPLKQGTAWYKIVPSKVIRLTKSPPWKSKMAILWCDVSCHNNLDQHVNILNRKYFNFNFKCMGKHLILS